MAALLALMSLIACSPDPGEVGARGDGASTAARGPSVLLVSWDTVSAQHLALYGGAAQTPTLAALAARGARWTQAVTHFPETGYSHWSMMTGVEPALHGDLAQAHTSAWPGPTLAERFREQGYATGAFIGGITLESELSGLDRGFQVYEDGGQPSDEPRQRAAQVTGLATAWIRQQQGPFFAFVHYFDAHFPYDTVNAADCDPSYGGVQGGDLTSLKPFQGEAPPAPVLAPADLAHVQRLYECEIEAIDQQFARLLEAVPADTRVVVVADHGESFGGGYYFNHRASLRDEVLVVPLVVSPPPPGVERGAVIADQVGLSAVFSLAQGQAAPPSPVVATGTDPWIGPGLLSLRAGADKAVWRLTAGAPGRPTGSPVAIYHGDQRAPEGAELPSSLEGAISAWEARIRALEPQMRQLPPAQGPGPTEALQSIGYLPPSEGR